MIHNNIEFNIKISACICNIGFILLIQHDMNTAIFKLESMKSFDVLGIRFDVVTDF